MVRKIKLLHTWLGKLYVSVTTVTGWQLKQHSEGSRRVGNNSKGEWGPMYSYPLHSAISVFRIQAANHLPECMFKFEGCRYRKLSTWMWICQGSLNSRHDWWVATCNHADDYYSSHTVSHIGCTGWEYNFSAILPFGLGDSLCILGTAYTTWCFGMFSKTPTPWYGNASPSISALTLSLKLADIVDVTHYLCVKCGSCRWKLYGELKWQRCGDPAMISVKAWSKERKKGEKRLDVGVS